jgi:MYXO-CTERM domain-containing protein
MTDASTDDGPTDSDFLATAKAAIKIGAVAISFSFGGEEFSDPTGQDYTKPGHLVLAAAGDAGYLNQLYNGTTPSYPSSAPDVLSVGGTTLQLTGDKYSEVVWNDGSQGGATGSGCSTEFPMPAFQSQFLSSTPNAFGSCTKRATVDVSAAAEFAPGAFAGAIAEYDSVNDWVPVVGTSAASPMVAGIFTRLGLTDAVSGNLGWVYDNITAFNDITSGTNDVEDTCTSVMCKAGKGWDGPTGVGTPNGPNLVALVAVPADAGAEGGDEDGGTPPKSSGSSKSGCGCRTAGARGLDPWLLALGLPLVALALRRRRK